MGLSRLEQQRLAAKRYRERHPDRVKASQKKYADANREKRREACKLWRKKNKDKVSEYNHNCVVERPKMIRAKNRIRTLINNGTIERGCCEECGRPNAQAHHDNYDFPEDIRWLCSSCHKKWHYDNRKVVLNG